MVRHLSWESEADMAAVLVRWLQDQRWDVYQEVELRGLCGVCDIIAVSGSLVWSIECKLSFGLAVVEQAVCNHTLLRSVAVPYAPGWGINSRYRGSWLLRQVCEQYGVGVLAVPPGGEVHESLAPRLMREFRDSSSTIRSGLTEGHRSCAKAGSPSGAGRWSPYRDTMYKVKRFLSDHPGATLKELLAHGSSYHYASTQSARAHLPKCLRTFEQAWCREENGRFWLKEEVKP